MSASREKSPNGGSRPKFASLTAGLLARKGEAVPAAAGFTAEAMAQHIPSRPVEAAPAPVTDRATASDRPAPAAPVAPAELAAPAESLTPNAPHAARGAESPASKAALKLPADQPRSAPPPVRPHLTVHRRRPPTLSDAAQSDAALSHAGAPIPAPGPQAHAQTKQSAERQALPEQGQGGRSPAKTPAPQIQEVDRTAQALQAQLATAFIAPQRPPQQAPKPAEKSAEKTASTAADVRPSAPPQLQTLKPVKPAGGDVTPFPAPARPVEAAPAKAPNRRHAMTLRIDPERYVRLKIAAAKLRKTSQSILTEALDQFLDDLDPAVCDSCDCLGTTNRSNQG
ncbi:MAG: hypothetical protein AAGH45_00270 [Pseudomonadota bacterium]